MLVVSDIDLPTDIHAMKPTAFINSSIKDFVLNLSNDYRYLKSSYYVSMHAEVLGDQVIPSSQNIIDASRIPILLLKASKNDIPTLPYLVTDSARRIISAFGFPLIIFAVNPFSYDGFKIAENRSGLYRAMKSLTMNHKFAVCVQPLRGEILSVKSIFGRCESEEADRISRQVYRVFGLSMCKLHVQMIGSAAYLCGLQPLGMEELYPDLDIVSTEVFRLSNQGECLVG